MAYEVMAKLLESPFDGKSSWWAVGQRDTVGVTALEAKRTG